MTVSEKYIYSLRLGIDPHYWDQTKMEDLKDEHVTISMNPWTNTS